MKILTSLFLVSALFLTTCVSIARDTITGSGNVTTQDRSATGFDKIENKSSINVIITKSDAFTLKVEADDNIIPYVLTEVKNNILTVRIDNDVNIKGSKKINVYVSLPLVKSIAVMGSGNISSNDKFGGENIEVQVKGSGDIRFSFDGNKASILTKGSGDIKFDGNVAHSELGIYGSGNVQMATQGSDADLTIRGSGNINLSGTTKAIKGVIQGSGNIEAERFNSENAEITIQGSGDCKLSVAQSLDVKIQGSGDVYYTGNPGNVSCKSLGSGKVKKI